MATNGRPGEAAAARVASAPGRAFTLAPGQLRAALRWLLAGLGLVVLAAALLVGTRQTSVFAVHEIEVRGAAGADARAVRRALRPLVGTSLASLQREDVMRRLDRLPVVSAAAYDRAFPHTLEVFVRTERPLAVLRRGPEAWLVSARGRVLRRLEDRRARARLPRIWLPRSVRIGLGRPLTGAGRAAVTGLVPVAGTPFVARVRSFAAPAGQVTMSLRSGVELRLGSPDAVPLKLAIARRIVPTLAAGGSPAYLDLTVPERPVAGPLKTQVER